MKKIIKTIFEFLKAIFSIIIGLFYLIFFSLLILIGGSAYVICIIIFGIGAIGENVLNEIGK